ncbi:DUF5329 domain-containing protein [Comamonas piscis]|uniref:DUF5329 domain-containing protein n=1 Tax=Comamonas piscis TaxID=1562974 RepID=A0A7G5EN90_9BURK|nr:DUF5329 domain-containing protein [Comamonas piscis]QMV75465.1 DUF5329 domain-containing protein [Comamonas piscis]WSO33974.1 DUF5329 domain-containing protein [Comamonas piscis]
MSHRQNPWTQALATACLLFSLTAGAQTTSGASKETTEREIQSLFKALQQSGCDFARNGQWYSASEASAHLERKYSYLQKKALAPTAEDFIARAASQSSMTSKPYLVRCPGQPELRSQQWFEAQLAKTRTAQ